MPLASFGRVPLHFERNDGQWDWRVRFLARGPGYALFLTDEGPALRLLESGVTASGSRAALVRMRLPGSARASGIEPASRLGGISHHYQGADRAHWRTGQEHFARVTYTRVYPGIDVSYYGNQRQLEYDFLVEPGADPGRIRMRFDGVRKVALETGELVLDTPAGALRQRAPVAYQELEGGRRREVPVRFELRGREVRFRLGPYDRKRALVIDPVLVYSTYLGGEETASPGAGEEASTAVAVDATGSAVVVGYTSAFDFPLSAAYQDDNLGYRDVFVSRFTPAGDALVFSTYLGGNDNDQAYGVALDPSGNIYVTGATTSFNFPTTPSAYQTSNGGPCCLGDAFVASLSPAGLLRYSTYVGGYSDDRASGIAVNAAGEATIAGATYSDDYPVTTGAFQLTRSGIQDAFVTRLAASGSSLLASTYLGGGSYDAAAAVALDGAGNAYVAGATASSNFPTLNPYQGATSSGSGFVTKLNPALSALGFSTCLGGSGDDSITAIALDAAGRPCVAGETTSTDFPTVGAYQANQPASDGFVTMFAASGSAVAFSTYLGGNGNDAVRALAIDASGNVHVAGSTTSTNFPTLNAVSGDQAGQDAFVAKLAPSGALLYSTYLGGGASDLGYYAGLALGPTGDAYVAGATASADFPTVGPFQGMRRGSWDAFLARLQSAVKGDLDRNGQADLLFHNTLTGENQVWPLDGVTLSGPPAPITPAVPSLDWLIEGVDDFDGDERSDLMFRNQANGATELWLMNGAARVGAPVPLAGAPLPPWRLSATADCNRDGRPDLVWRNYATQKISIWTMNGTTQLGTLTPTPDQALDGNWEIAAALDYNGDSYTDLLWYNWSSGKIVLWFMDQNVERLTGQFTGPSNAGNANWKVLAGGDYGVGPGGVPGTKDIVWRNATSGKVVVWYMDRAGNRTAGTFTSPDAPNPVPTDWVIAGPR